jgi:hypothetical protein
MIADLPFFPKAEELAVPDRKTVDGEAKHHASFLSKYGFGFTWPGSTVLTKELAVIDDLDASSRIKPQTTDQKLTQAANGSFSDQRTQASVLKILVQMA